MKRKKKYVVIVAILALGSKWRVTKGVRSHNEPQAKLRLKNKIKSTR